MPRVPSKKLRRVTLCITRDSATKLVQSSSQDEFRRGDLFRIARALNPDITTRFLRLKKEDQWQAIISLAKETKENE